MAVAHMLPGLPATLDELKTRCLRLLSMAYEPQEQEAVFPSSLRFRLPNARIGAEEALALRTTFDAAGIPMRSLMIVDMANTHDVILLFPDDYFAAVSHG